MASLDGITRFRKLDIRPWIARGEQPLDRVLEVLGRLGPGEALALHAPFLPAPLIERLSSEGYEYHFEPGTAAHWTVYFWRPEALGSEHVR